MLHKQQLGLRCPGRKSDGVSIARPSRSAFTPRAFLAERAAITLPSSSSSYVNSVGLKLRVVKQHARQPRLAKTVGSKRQVAALCRLVCCRSWNRACLSNPGLTALVIILRHV